MKSINYSSNVLDKPYCYQVDKRIHTHTLRQIYLGHQFVVRCTTGILREIRNRMSTGLSAEQQQAIRYWTSIAGVPIFQADTRNKKISLKGWQEIDFTKVELNQN